jgi:hypothetical protein
MGRIRQGNYTSQKNNSIENLVGNEQNEHPVPDPNKIMINELSDAHKKTLKEEIKEDIPKKLMEKLQDMINQKV